MKSWENTRKSFVNWLSECGLRKEFSEKVKFEGLSLWWLSDLMGKDNINESDWYIDLNKRLVPLIQSSIYMKDLNCSPLPQISK